MIQLVCLNGEVFAHHDGDFDVPMTEYPAGCTIVPWSKSLFALPFVEPAPPEGQPDMRHRRKAPVLTDPVDLKAYAASVRYYRSISGVRVDGVLFATDDATEAKIGTKLQTLQADPEASISWKAPGGFVTLNAESFTAMAKAVAAFREACFAAEAKADRDITNDVITTTDQIDALLASAGA